MKKLLLAVCIFLGCFIMPNYVHARNSYGWGLPKNQTGVRPNPGKLYEEILARHQAIYIDKNNDHKVYLTFDAGFENGYTETILDTLKEENVKATFFLTGQYLDKNPEIVRRMVKEGHTIGNHTYHHPDLTAISREEYERDIKLFEEKYYQITNKKAAKIMRPPSGTFNDQSLQIADELGYYTIFWSLAYKDWEINHQRGAEYAYQSVMERMHPGAIILLHNVSKDNADALKQIIVAIKEQGYQFGSIMDLIIARELYI